MSAVWFLTLSSPEKPSGEMLWHQNECFPWKLSSSAHLTMKYFNMTQADVFQALRCKVLVLHHSHLSPDICKHNNNKNGVWNASVQAGVCFLQPASLDFAGSRALTSCEKHKQTPSPGYFPGQTPPAPNFSGGQSHLPGGQGFTVSDATLWRAEPQKVIRCQACVTAPRREEICVRSCWEHEHSTGWETRSSEERELKTPRRMSTMFYHLFMIKNRINKYNFILLDFLMTQHQQTVEKLWVWMLPLS